MNREANLESRIGRCSADESIVLEDGVIVIICIIPGFSASRLSMASNWDRIVQVTPHIQQTRPMSRGLSSITKE